MPGMRYFYLMLLFFLTLTGFGQMPIFKRFYIADLPGLGWLADFYITHFIHYLGAILILALAAYMILDYGIMQRKRLRLTASGYLRGAILMGILISGLLLVMRNRSDTRFSPSFIILLDLTHLGLVMTFLTAAGYCLVRKRRWITPR
jgi:hypothetical protein